MAEDGRTCRIHYFRPLSNCKLRCWLATPLVDKHQIEWILRLPDHVFEGVGIYPIVTVAHRSNHISENIVKYFEFKSAKELESANKSGVKNSRVVSVTQSSLKDDPWLFVPPWASKLLNQFRNSFTPLESVARKIFTGIATGANSTFVLRGRMMELEPDRLVPALIAPDVKKGKISWSGHYLLNPYEIVKDTPQPIDLDQFPRMKRYLETQKELLKLKYHTQRSRKDWYETHDTIDIRLARKKKIITPDIASSNRFAVDRGEFLCLNTCNIILYDESKKTEALAAILNSATFEFMLKLSSPRFGKQYFRYMKQNLRSLPVPNPETMTSETVARLSSSYIDKDWNALNKYVFDLYEVPKEARDRMIRFTQDG
jgi:hypothetical protein